MVEIYNGLYYDEIKQEISFIIIAAALTFFLSVALLISICSECLSPRARHVLATLNIILEFAIAVVLALRASNNSNLKDSSLNVYGTVYEMQINTTTSESTTSWCCPTPSSPLCSK